MLKTSAELSRVFICEFRKLWINWKKIFYTFPEVRGNTSVHTSDVIMCYVLCSSCITSLYEFMNKARNSKGVTGFKQRLIVSNNQVHKSKARVVIVSLFVAVQRQ